MPELVTDVPKIILAVYAHPDDADVACGGALCSWIKKGAVAHLVVCTDGGKGTFDPDLSSADLTLQRARELKEAAQHIGLSSHHTIGAPDGELDRREGFGEELVSWIRKIKPDVVIGHDPTAVFFGQEYFNHADHRAAGWALLDAVAPAAALPHYFPDAGPPHQTEVVYLTGTLEPDVWVDVTSTIEAKVTAVECHHSQFDGGEGQWAGDAVRRRAEEEGRRAGVRFAEGFRRLQLGG